MRLWSAGIAACLLLVSCGQQVFWTSKTDCSPPVGECRYKLTTTISADATKGYVNRNRKEVRLVLGDKDGRELLRRNYAVEAGEMEVAVRWEDAGAEVVFYERRGVGLKQVLALRFQRDGAGQFDEAAAPVWTGEVVQNHLAKDNAWQTIQMDFGLNEASKKMAVDGVTKVAGEAGLVRAEHRAVNTLATFVAEGIRLEVVEFAKEELLRVRMESDEHREEARRIWTGLRSLRDGEVERTIVMTMPTGKYARVDFLRSVEGIASKMGLKKSGGCAEAYLACYSDGGISIRPWTRFTENELSVMFTESGWSARGDEVESAVRKELLGR